MKKSNRKGLLRAAVSMLAMAAVPAGAQALRTGDVALTYQWVHSNAQPGDCGCFSLNGGGLSASLNVGGGAAVVAEASGGFEGRNGNGNSLTLVSYMGGLRYSLAERGTKPHRLQPFAQALVGGAHAGGSLAGAGDGTSAFALRVGGGLDLTLQRVIALRLVQADYYLTDFANTTNNHQNNVLLGAGLVFRF